MLVLADFRVDPAVHDRHPDYVAAILLADGIGNGASDARSDRLLAGAEASYAARVLERPADHPHPWRSPRAALQRQVRHDRRGTRRAGGAVRRGNGDPEDR